MPKLIDDAFIELTYVKLDQENSFHTATVEDRQDLIAEAVKSVD